MKFVSYILVFAILSIGMSSCVTFAPPSPGVAGNAVVLPGQTQLNDSIPPPNTSFLLLNFGAAGNINSNQKFIIEGGYGYIFPNGEKNGPAFYISAGLLFYIGNEN